METLILYSLGSVVVVACLLANIFIIKSCYKLYEKERTIKAQEKIKLLADISSLDMYSCCMQFSVIECTFAEFKQRNNSYSLSYYADDNAEGYELPTRTGERVWLPKDVFHLLFCNIANDYIEHH